MDESAGDGSHSNKQKSVDKLSGASRRKLAKEASLKIDASKCLKLTSFMTKIPTIQSSLEVHAEIEAVSDDLHPALVQRLPTPLRLIDHQLLAWNIMKRLIRLNLRQWKKKKLWQMLFKNH